MNGLRGFLVFAVVLSVCLNGPGLFAQKVQTFKGELKKDNKKKTFEKEQVHKVKLEEGQEYLFDLTSKDFDALLRVLDADGKELAANDDGGQWKNARLGFTPETTGEYQLVATSFGERWAGKYEITVQPINKAGEPEVKKGQIEKKAAKADRFPAQGFKVEMEKGNIYRLDLESSAFSPALLIYRDKGNLLAADRASGEAKDARLYFIPPDSGTYEVRALVQLPLLGTVQEKTPAGEFTLTIQQYEAAKEQEQD